MKTRGFKKWIAIGSAALLGLGGTASAQRDDSLSDSPMLDEQMQSDMPDYQEPVDQQAIEPAPAPSTSVEINQYDASDSGMGGSGSEGYNSSRKEKGLPGVASLRVGGGIEAPSTSLRDQLAVGPLWTAAAALQPFTWMGLEGAYSGSTFEVDNRISGARNEGAINGADFVRNGGQVAATFNLPTPFIQPYALGGVGIDRTNYRPPDNGQFRDDTSGRVPLGGGLRTSVAGFVADLRGNYNVLFDQDFARTSAANKNGSSYDVGLQVGAQF